LLVHNTGQKFLTGWVKNIYSAAKAQSQLRIEADRLPDAEVADWISQSKAK
jgi:hypothetical protein